MRLRVCMGVCVCACVCVNVVVKGLDERFLFRQCEANYKAV